MSNLSASELHSTHADRLRYQHAIQEIYQQLNYERSPDSAKNLNDFRLVNMQDLLLGLNQPQLSVPTVHIAGTKGKGSTATMVARIAQSAGYRVGLFTSPHINAFEERFTVNGHAATHRQVADLFEKLRSVCDRLKARPEGFHPTFFELATAMGWLHFAEQQVDLAVIEVGLGGRLDTTNVCQPLVTAITSISRDHTRLLGETLAEIAREKAGIIKQGIPVVSAVIDESANEAIAQSASQFGATQYRLSHEFQIRSTQLQRVESTEIPCYSFDFHGLGEDFFNVELSLAGEHQTRNAAVATAVSLLLRRCDYEITEEAIRTGLREASLPLRVEVISRHPTTIVDAAHNPASIAALCDTLNGVNFERRILLFASSSDKEADAMLRILDGSMDEIYLTRFTNNPRSIELEELKKLADQNLTKPWRLFGTIEEAIEAARGVAHSRDLICITGSFFLAAEARSLLTKNPETT
ncbi:bifunctional folylpolyglutamate synthase/dihydrofolate synthase [Planctomicrobium sp. SH668]|uniref:bifunctional folylpolyglutamate synthase/dihydrofolate synthase n=1 Tax=Planctomicrobium sp. SH668 TaxID=3448126 RepID=UPI003F5B1B18